MNACFILMCVVLILTSPELAKATTALSELRKAHEILQYEHSALGVKKKNVEADVRMAVMNDAVDDAMYQWQ